jgi:hypothetical protein
MTDIFDPAELAALAELFDVSAVAETSDYKSGKGGFRPTGPGEFTSLSRTIARAENVEGVFKATLLLDGGLQSADGSVSDTRYPLKAYLSSKPYTPEGGAGHTTSLAEYFKSVGIDPSGRPVSELVSMLGDTLSLPAPVWITWTDKRKLNAGTGEWTGGDLRAKDFVVGGDRKNPIYSPTITKDGVTYQATSKVSRFISTL